MANGTSQARRWGMLGLLLVLAVLVGVGVWYRANRPTQPDMTRVLELNTRGVAHMDRFDYKLAEEQFAQVVQLAPDWLPGHINLGIALLNQNAPETINAAIQRFEFVLARDPDNPHAHYCLGFVLAYRENYPDAVPHFEAVTRVDPNDAGAWYQLGSVLVQVHGVRGDDPDLDKRATDCFLRAHRLNPYMLGPLNALQSRLDDPQVAAEVREQMAKLTAGEALMPNTLKYTEQGSRYACAIGKTEETMRSGEVAPLPLFEPFQDLTVKLAEGVRWATAADLGQGADGDLRRAIRQRFGGTMATLDYNRDGKLDLFLAGAVVDNGKLRDLLLRNDGKGTFTDVTKAVGLDQFASLGVSVADFDNDHFPDLVRTGIGQQLLRNRGDGTFEDVSAKAGVKDLAGVGLGTAWVDLEQDGDLDLLVAVYGSNADAALKQLTDGTGGGQTAVLLNVGEAAPVQSGQPLGPLTTAFQRFSDIEKALQVPQPPIGFAVTDADGDVDIDALLLHDRVAPSIAINDRLLRFRRTELPLDGKPWNGALVLDVDQDERSDLLLLTAGEAPLLLMNRSVAGAQVESWYERGAVNSPPLKQARVIDIDLDGWPDVLGLADNGRPVLLHNDRNGRLVQVAEALGNARDWPGDAIAVAPVRLDGDGFADLLVWSESQGLQARRSSGNGNAVIAVRLVGRRDSGRPPSERSNNDGIGTRVTVQAGRNWSTAERTTLSAGLGQSSEPMLFGIGRSGASDAVVRLRWPDLTVQAEFLATPKSDHCELIHGDLWQIAQVNRKPVSCPVLITWDGEKWVYLTDFLGAGSLGEMLPAGGTRVARPEESLKIESRHLQPREGFYTMRIAEPMDEVTYLDRLRLDVIDLPPGVDVLPDERFATSDPPPTQQRLYFRDRYFARKAIDERGRDVTATLRDHDGKTVHGFDYRSWIGFAGDHWVELDFGDALKSMGAKDRVMMVLAGWTDYPYPESIFAAIQAGVPVIAPVLERETSPGQWETVCELGFPAGLPRIMTRDLTGLIAGHTGRLRIRTNMQIYWDQVFLAPLVDAPQAKVAELEVATAELSYRGMLREVRPDDSPLIAYDPNAVEAAPVNRWKGHVTRLGDVTPLLSATDDRFVILGPGDDMTVRFDARSLPPLPSGWSRQFVLRSWGWCKDASLFTATGGEVGPLPFRAMSQYPPKANEPYPHPSDLQHWHTRRPR